MSFNNESTLACLGLNKDILLFDVFSNHIAKVFSNSSFENNTILDILWPNKIVKTRKKVEKLHHIILLTHERVFVYDYENQNLNAAIDVKNLNQHKLCESYQKLFICNDNEILVFNMEGKLIKNLVLKNIVGHIINALSICSTEYQTYLITNTFKALQIWDVTPIISSKYNSRHLKQSTEIQAILTIPLNAAKDGIETDISGPPLINITQLHSFIIPYKTCNINNKNNNNERIDHNNNCLVTNENTHFIDNSQSSSIFTSESDLDSEQKPSQNSRVLRSKRKVREKLEGKGFETTNNQEDGVRSMFNGDKDTHVNGHSQHLLSSTLQPDLQMNLIVQSTNVSENNNSLELWQIPFYSLNELNTTTKQNTIQKSITKFVIPNATENTKILRINYKSTQNNIKDSAAKPHLYVSATLNDGSLIIYSLCLDENNLNSSSSLNTPQNSINPKWIIRYERSLLSNTPIICYNGDYNLNDNDDSTINNGDLNVTKNVSPTKKVKKRKINNPETHNPVLPSLINLPIICAQFLCSEEEAENSQSSNENGFTNNHKDNLAPRVILGYKNYVALKSEDADALSVNSEDTDSNSINQQTRKSLRKSALKKKAKTTTKTAGSTKFNKIPNPNFILLDEEPYELDSENPIIFETLNLETLTPGFTPNIILRDLKNHDTNVTLNHENFTPIINKNKPSSYTNSTFIDGDNNTNCKPLEDFTKFFDEQDYVDGDENQTRLLSQKTADTTTLDTLVNVSETSTKTLIAKNSPDTTLKIDETLPLNKSSNIDCNHNTTQNINECVDSGIKFETHINEVSSRVENHADLPENDAMEVIGNEDYTMIETNYSYHIEESKLEHTQTSIISPKKLQTLSKISNQSHTTSANQTSLSLRVKQILQEKKQNMIAQTSKVHQQNSESTKGLNNIIPSTAILNNSTNHGFLTNETLKQPLKKLTNSVKSQNVIPQANTVITVLDQALKSGDLQKFTHIILINGRKEHIVRETMRNFPPAMLNLFMRQLGSSMTYAHTNEMMISLTWLDAILQFHTSFIESNPKLGALMFAMQDLLSQRILNTHKRLQLKGNIDYVKTQMFLRAQEDALHGQHSPNLDNQDAFVYYEDSDTEFEDNEQLMDDL